VFLSHHQLSSELGTLLGILKPTAGKQFGGGLARAASTASLVPFDVGNADARDAKEHRAKAAVKSERIVFATGAVQESVLSCPFPRRPLPAFYTRRVDREAMKLWGELSLSDHTFRSLRYYSHRSFFGSTSMLPTSTL
jgi:hypothetical protein